MSRGFSRLLPFLLTAAAPLLLPAPLGAQDGVRVRTEENFRREPNGEILARLSAGTRLAVVDRSDRWLGVELEGWVWERSLQRSTRDDLGLVVSEPQGENLRGAPSGPVLAVLERGTLLEEVGREPGWIRVRRRGWVWGPSTLADTPAEPATTAAAGSPAATFTAGPASGAVVLSAPDGDTLARATPGTQIEVVGRQGSWARVRLEGWAWLPESGDTVAMADPSSLEPGDLAGEPREHRGRVVVWTLHFISLERAERVRTDFYEGEPFLLCRYGDSDGVFVYVAVPPDRMADIDGLVPLESIRVTGRVRTGASALTGTPVLDLIQIQRGGGAR